MSFDSSTKNSNTFSSNKKKQLYIENNPYLNKEQIIIDWINTIKLPHCLLINSLNDKEIQENGIIFIEILKYFLKKLGIENFNSDERLNKFQRINLIITSIIELNKVNNFNLNLNNKLLYFQNNVQELFENKNLMIKFFELVKKIFEQININDNSSMEMENINKNNIINQNNLNKNKLTKKQNLRNYSLGINNNNNNNNYVKLQSLISNNNNNNTINSFNGKSLSASHSISLSISPINPEKYKKIFFEDRLFKNNIYNKQNENKTLNANNSSHKNFFNFSNNNFKNSKINNFNTINNNLNINNNNNNNKLNIFNNNFGIYKSINNFIYNIPIYKIFHLTKPILNIKLNNNSNESNYKKYNQKIINNKKYLTLKSNSQKHFLIDTLNFPIKNTLKFNNKENIKLKIKKWLIKINLLNELSLSEKNNISILYLSYTGLLFCNIINKYNNKAIKGIITNPITKNQNIININKFFDYCKENKNLFYKDIKKYLNLNLILNKNEEIIFKILYVLYNFYYDKEEINNNNNNKFNTNNNNIKINNKINIKKLNFDYIFNKQNNNNNFTNNFPKTSRNDSKNSKNLNLFKKYNNYKNNNSTNKLNKNNNNKTTQNNFINKDSSSLLNLYNTNSEFNINNNNNNNFNIINENDFIKYFHNNKHKNNNENNNFSNDSVSCSSIIISPSTNSSLDCYDNNYIENLFSKKRFKSSNTKLNNKNNYFINNNNLTSQVPNYYLLFNINDNNINNNTCIKKRKIKNNI